MPNIEDWRQFSGTFSPQDNTRQVDFIDCEVIANDVTSRDKNNVETPFYFTDIMLQGEKQRTGWVPNTLELLDRIEFTVNEQKNYAGFSTPIPFQTYTPLQLNYKRLVNIMGRGFESLTFPNFLPEPEFWAASVIGSANPVETLPTGIDIVLTMKGDYDLLRISTDYGDFLDPEDQYYKDVIAAIENNNDASIVDLFRNNPVHKRYTKEFWISGGNKGDIINILSSSRTATKNGSALPTFGMRQYVVDGRPLFIDRNSFFTASHGPMRLRVEPYKLVPISLLVDNGSGGTTTETYNLLKDTGIGYQGYVRFLQWTYGKVRV